MEGKKIYITRMIPEKAIIYLQNHYNVEVNSKDRPLDRHELLEAVKDRHAVITMINDRVDAELMDYAGSQCRIYANYAVGYNNIDVPAATERGIFVSNTPDVLTNATADMAWALLLAAARRVAEGDRVIRSGGLQDGLPSSC